MDLNNETVSFRLYNSYNKETPCNFTNSYLNLLLIQFMSNTNGVSNVVSNTVKDLLDSHSRKFIDNKILTGVIEVNQYEKKDELLNILKQSQNFNKNDESSRKSKYSHDNKNDIIDSNIVVKQQESIIPLIPKQSSKLNSKKSSKMIALKYDNGGLLINPIQKYSSSVGKNNLSKIEEHHIKLNTLENIKTITSKKNKQEEQQSKQVIKENESNYQKHLNALKQKAAKTKEEINQLKIKFSTPPNKNYYLFARIEEEEERNKILAEAELKNKLINTQIKRRSLLKPLNNNELNCFSKEFDIKLTELNKIKENERVEKNKKLQEVISILPKGKSLSYQKILNQEKIEREKESNNKINLIYKSIKMKNFSIAVKENLKPKIDENKKNEVMLRILKDKEKSVYNNRNKRPNLSILPSYEYLSYNNTQPLVNLNSANDNQINNNYDNYENIDLQDLDNKIDIELEQQKETILDLINNDKQNLENINSKSLSNSCHHITSQPSIDNKNLTYKKIKINKLAKPISFKKTKPRIPLTKYPNYLIHSTHNITNRTNMNKPSKEKQIDNSINWEIIFNDATIPNDLKITKIQNIIEKIEILIQTEKSTNIADLLLYSLKAKLSLLDLSNNLNY